MDRLYIYSLERLGRLINGMTQINPLLTKHATHVEGQADALMVDNNVRNMTVTINHRDGPCPICRSQIRNLLPVGSTLSVKLVDVEGVTQTTLIHGLR